MAAHMASIYLYGSFVGTLPENLIITLTARIVFTIAKHTIQVETSQQRARRSALVMCHVIEKNIFGARKKVIIMHVSVETTSGGFISVAVGAKKYTFTRHSPKIYVYSGNTLENNGYNMKEITAFCLPISPYATHFRQE